MAIVPWPESAGTVSSDLYGVVSTGSNEYLKSSQTNISSDVLAEDSRVKCSFHVEELGGLSSQQYQYAEKCWSCLAREIQASTG